MKSNIFLVLLLCTCFKFSFSQANPAELLARRMANTMRDTLALTGLQAQKVYTINLTLSTKKMQARTLSTDRIIVRNAIQTVEKTRDSLYRIELTATQYKLYLQKKRNIIKSN